MKKPYSLDFEIKLAKDRNQAVIDILDNLDKLPSDKEIEQMADYILFGKDEKNLSIVDTKEVLQPERRFNSWKTKAEKNESLDALLEDPVTAPDIENKVAGNTGPRYKVVKPEIHRPKYDDDGNMVEPGDSDVPGMVELWKIIDDLQERYDMYRGKLPASDWIKTHPISNYQLYKMGHMLIDIRRHQYYLKDSYKPTIKFFNIQPPGKPVYEFGTNTGLWLSVDEWCERKRNPHPYDMEQPSIQDTKMDSQGRLYWKISDNEIDYENPDHILAILDNYVSLLKSSYENFHSSTRVMCWDMEWLIENSDLSDVEQFILEQRVAHRNVFRTQKALAEEGILMTDAQIRSISRIKIPRKLSQTALRMRLECGLRNGEIEGLKCSKCKQILPKHPFYFARSRDKRSGYCSQCKCCQKAKRDADKEVRP